MLTQSVATVDVLRELRDHGVAQMPDVHGVGALRSYLATCLEYPGHMKNRAHRAPGGTTCYDMIDLLGYPGVLDVAMGVRPFAAAYLGQDCLLYSVDAYWTRLGPVHRGLQEWHVDRDQEKFLALFILCTDVLTPEEGAFEIKGPDGVVRQMFGPAGTCFVADTRLLHRGIQPATQPRLMTWARWGCSPTPAAYIADGTRPVPASRVPGFPHDPEVQQAIRLIAA